MKKVLSSFKLGVERGWTELLILIRDPQTIIWTAVILVIFMVVLWFQKDTQIDGISLALLTLPSLLGLQVVSSGMNDVASVLASDREDGTLFRAKAIPRGMNAYFVARIVVTLLFTILNVFLLLLASIIIAPNIVQMINPGDMVLAFGLIILGLLATAPIGATIGSLVKTAGSGWGLSLLPLAILTTISGIFYPITALYTWIQVVAQVFPVYWVALGFRSIFSPEAAAAAELTGSWRTWEMIAILAAWAIVGLLVVPRVLRRMTRRASGSEMQAAREAALQRGY